MDLNQFGDLVKSKYNQYVSVPSIDLARKVVDKFPMYAEKVTDGLRGITENYTAITNEQQQRYGKQATADYTASSAPIIPNINLGPISEAFQKKQLPGRTIISALAQNQANDPVYQVKQKMATGQPITDQEKKILGQNSMNMISGTTGSVDPLIEEAKKYKSAEDFIQAQGENFYHGANTKIDKFKTGIKTMRNEPSSGVYFSPYEEVAKTYARDNGNISNVYIRRLGIKNPKEISSYMKMGTLEKADVEKAISEGYDGFHYTPKDGNKTSEQWFAFNTNKILSDEQLADIYNRANKLPNASTGTTGNIGKTSLYHGTTPDIASKIEKNGFEVSKSADGSIWFTDALSDIQDPSRGVAATGQGGLVKRILPKGIKLADESLTDNYGVNEIMSMGYDGVKYSPSENQGTWYQIFYPEKLK